MSPKGTPENQTDILVATTNPSKCQEMLAAFIPVEKFSGRRFTSLQDEPYNALKEEPEEDGITFSENAKIKANFYHDRFPNSDIISDDSGLSIEALDGKPGIHSSRWAKESGGFEVAFRRIEESVDKPTPKAVFTCVIAGYFNNQYYEAEGVLHGTVSFPPSGSSGFGYDPIFIPSGHNISLASMTPEEKQQISHRAIAVKNFIEKLT